MNIASTVTRAVGKQLLVAQKHMPHILFGAGVAGVVTSTVLACKATLKLGDKLDTIKQEVQGCKDGHYQPNLLAHKDGRSAEVDHRRDLAVVYVRGTAGIAKLYAPAAIIGTLSIAALTGSHVTLARRNAALAAAYTSLAETFKAYRDRVREQVGEEKERELYLGAPISIDKKTGTKLIGTTSQAGDISQYARWFMPGNVNWQKSPEHNRYYIDIQIKRLNDTLKWRGHMFLNEVYDELGLTHTSQGALVGWTWPPREGCDGVIICDIMASAQEFQVADEYSLLLDFNVDGIIWDLIDP